MPLPRSSKKNASRKVDAESGFNRTRPSKKKAPLPVESSSESEEVVDSNSELESDLEMPVKDDSRRKPKQAAAPTKNKSRDNRRKAIKGQEADDNLSDLEGDSGHVAPHMMLMLGAAYHLAIGSISQPSISSFIPSAGNLFMMLYEMTSLLVDNTLLHEMYPGFCSVSLYLYYSHVYYYQVLRAREATGHGVLSRIERRVLTLYKQVGPPESWPIAAPLIGFISSIGSHKSENPMFSWIVPSLPDLSVNHSGTATTPTYSLTGLSEVTSASLIPIVPAYQQFLHNIGEDTAKFENEHLYPKGSATLGTSTFLGLASSATTAASFQTLAFNEAWNAAPENASLNGQIEFDTKRKIIKRWKVPTIPDTAELTNLQAFLGLGDSTPHEWMKHLLTTSAFANRFFPGSTTLAEISPVTSLGRLIHVKYDVITARTAAANTWYHGRTNWKISYNGYSNTESGIIDSKIGIVAAVNAEYSNNTFPTNARRVNAHRTGPFFTDQNTAGHERSETFITEGQSGVDPARRFSELLSSYFDESAGRSRK